MARNVQTNPALAEGAVASENSNPHAAGPAGGALPLVTQGRAPQMGGTPGMPNMMGENRDASLSTGIAGSAIGKFNADLVVPFKRYRVLNGGYLMYNGVRTALRAGKIVDDRNYDMPRLRGQGFRLELVRDDEDGDGYTQNTPDTQLPPLPGAPR